MEDNRHTGKTCPYCMTPIKVVDKIEVCPVCDMPHHKECWSQNRGCTTFGCVNMRNVRRTGSNVTRSAINVELTSSGNPMEPASHPAHYYRPGIDDEPLVRKLRQGSFLYSLGNTEMGLTLGLGLLFGIPLLIIGGLPGGFFGFFFGLMLGSRLEGFLKMD